MTRRPSLLTARSTPGAILDTALAVAALASSLVLVTHGGIDALRPGSNGSPASGDLDLTGVVLVAFSTLPLAIWRHSPLGVFATTAAASVLLVGLDYPLGVMIGPAAALYLLAASRGPLAPWTARTTVIVVGLLVAYLGAAAVAQGRFPGTELLHSGLAWAVAWFAGERARLRREQIAELRERALRAERDAERERMLAAAEERARIARDLHDSAGHAISVIAVRAGAARLRHADDPIRTIAALQEIEELARQTVGEIDQIVGTLRQGGPSPDPGEAPPGMASLDPLIAQHETAGLTVTLDTAGTPRPFGAPADQAAYRIMQEALTNVARHGAGAAHIELVFGDTAVDFTVTNPLTAAPTARTGGGHGLIGMRERAVLAGGSFDAERSNGTFRIHTHIPYGGNGE